MKSKWICVLSDKGFITWEIAPYNHKKNTNPLSNQKHFLSPYFFSYLSLTSH